MTRIFQIAKSIRFSKIDSGRVNPKSKIQNPKSEIDMAERVGFEPTVPVKAQQFSRLPDSTTLAPLRELLIIKVRVRKYQARLERRQHEMSAGVERRRPAGSTAASAVSAVRVRAVWVFVGSAHAGRVPAFHSCRRSIRAGVPLTVSP